MLISWARVPGNGKKYVQRNRPGLACPSSRIVSNTSSRPSCGKPMMMKTELCMPWRWTAAMASTMLSLVMWRFRIVRRIFGLPDSTPNLTIRQLAAARIAGALVIEESHVGVDDERQCA